MLVEIKKENDDSILINTEKVVTITPTRTTFNWNCCSIQLEDGTFILSSESYEEIKRKVVKNKDVK